MRFRLDAISKSPHFGLYDPALIPTPDHYPPFDLEAEIRHGSLVHYCEEAGDAEARFTVLLDEPVDAEWQRRACRRGSGVLRRGTVWARSVAIGQT